MNLISDENAVVRVPTLKSELGKVEEYEITLENPSSSEVKVTIKKISTIKNIRSVFINKVTHFQILYTLNIVSIITNK